MLLPSRPRLSCDAVSPLLFRPTVLELLRPSVPWLLLASPEALRPMLEELLLPTVVVLCVRWCGRVRKSVATTCHVFPPIDRS